MNKIVKTKKNYGKLLEAAITKKGLTKHLIATEEFGVSRVWLNVLIKNNTWTKEQLVIVKRIIKK